MSNADIVNGWYRDRLTGGPLAQSTDAYNQLVGALPDLIGRLDAAAEAAIPPDPAPVAPVAAPQPAPAPAAPTPAPQDPPPAEAQPA